MLKPMIREADRGSVARSLVGRGDPLRRERIQAHPGAIRTQLGRRHQLVPLHQRGGVPRPEAGPRGIRQQQRRHLRPRLPLADRLRPLPHLRHVGRHAGLQVGRQADVVVVIGANPTDAHPVFASRLKKRLRAGARLIVSTRAGSIWSKPACRGRLSSRAQARNQCRGSHRHGACHRHRGPDRRGLRRRALRCRQFRVLGALRRRGAPRAGGGRRRRPASTRRGARGRAALCHRRQRRRSTTASASPSTRKARPR